MLRPRALQTSAEVLTPSDRQLLEETFRCPVFDRYGCREVGNIAHECEAHQGLHVLMENNLVEVLDEAGRPAPPGQVGRVVVTNLNNYVQPFIRYEIGDLTAWAEAPCACGRGLPLLQRVAGRASDILTSPSGRLLHGEFFTHLFYGLEGVRQFRVEQTSSVDLVIRIAPAPGLDRAALEARLAEAIHRHADAAFCLRFEYAEHLPPSRSGKYRFTINLTGKNG